jgi:hypothetical protein
VISTCGRKPLLIFSILSFTTEILWLFGTSLTGTLPTEIAGLVSLQHLIAFDTSLSGQLPDIFGALGSLQVLQLAHSAFSGALPPSLFQLPGIELISIEENSITGTLPETVTLPAIRTFNLLLVSQGNTIYSDQSHLFLSTESIRLGNQNPAIRGPIPTSWGTLVSLGTYHTLPDRRLLPSGL